jgi:hypothetical protein
MAILNWREAAECSTSRGSSHQGSNRWYSGMRLSRSPRGGAFTLAVCRTRAHRPTTKPSGRIHADPAQRATPRVPTAPSTDGSSEDRPDRNLLRGRTSPAATKGEPSISGTAARPASPLSTAPGSRAEDLSALSATNPASPRVNRRTVRAAWSPRSWVRTAARAWAHLTAEASNFLSRDAHPAAQ